MAPPPSTPTPHRFLVPKRSATQRNATPKPLHGGAQQFHATPRFSLHSTPREPVPSNSSSTPVHSVSFLRQRNADAISDAIDSSPPVPEASHILHDSIEVDSIAASSIFPSSDRGNLLEGSENEEGSPSPKRRRFSVSPDINRESSWPVLDKELVMIDDEEHPGTPYSDQSGDVESDASELPKIPSVQQPTFQRAPRFKAVDHPQETHHEPLPDAFSPHRRGTKYIPGGLAAELRDWLMDVESSTGAKRDGEFIAKVSIDQVRTNPGLMLTKGHRTLDENDAIGPRQGDQSLKILLAGEGRLTGIARQSEVAVGSLIGIAKPVWEVNLGAAGRWAVACDWVVL